MDSAYYNAAVIGAVRGQGARFSVTVPMNSSVRAAIAAIGEENWTAIRYPQAVWDDQLGRWISDAEVAETQYTAFASKKGRAVTARLIVRRVRDLNTKAAAGMDELFPVWRHHAVFTDSPFELVQAEGQHRGHAIVEQVFADVTSGPLAHLPSGHFAANAAWLSIAAMAHNLVRAAGGPGQPAPRQGQGRDDPPRPHRRRRPHRPPRTRPHHPPPPAGLAPRAGTAQPLGRGLRAARCSGLTSPRQVRTLHARQGHPETHAPTRNLRTSRRKRQRRETHAPTTAPNAKPQQQPPST